MDNSTIRETSRSVPEGASAGAADAVPIPYLSAGQLLHGGSIAAPPALALIARAASPTARWNRFPGTMET